MDLTALADFQLVAIHGSLNKASRVSGKPKTTLSRHVRDLEESLGIRLFERGARALRLTDEGKALQQRTQELLDEIETVGDLLTNGVSEPRGPLRVSAPLFISHSVLADVSRRFAEKYPNVSLEIVGDDRQPDLVENGIDIALRVNPTRNGSLVGRLIAYDDMLVVAAPSMALPRIDSEGAPATVPAISLTSDTSADRWRLVSGRKEHVIQPDVRLRVSSLLMVCEIVRKGGVVGVLPASRLTEHLERGSLLVWGTLPDRRLELWALHASRRLVCSKVRAFMDLLCEAFPERRFPEQVDLGKFSVSFPRD